MQQLDGDALTRCIPIAEMNGAAILQSSHDLGTPTNVLHTIHKTHSETFFSMSQSYEQNHTYRRLFQHFHDREYRLD